MLYSILDLVFREVIRKYLLYPFLAFWGATGLSACIFIDPLFYYYGGGGSSSSYNYGALFLPPPNNLTITVGMGVEFNENPVLTVIGSDEAYRRGYFGQGVTVGVVDSGVRTTHIDLTSNLIPGRRADSSGNLHTDINDADGHGTFVAGIIGAAINGTLVQGVAPSASIMPLQFGNTSSGELDGEPLALFGYAVANNVPILNNSWGQINTITGTYEGSSVTAQIPLIRTLLELYGGNLTNRFSRIAATVGSADMALVWAAGNDYWHEGGSIVAQVGGVPTTLAQTNFINGFTLNYNGQEIDFSTLNIDLNDPGGYALTPLYEPDLLGRWVHVIAVDSLSVIADFTNGCGRDTKYWCLAAPGVEIKSTYNTSDTAVTVASGASFSSPYVSGALAVLKSRLTDMPMSVILALLFNTATDLGAPGVDDVFGHGLLNLGEAITLQGNISISTPIIVTSTSSFISTTTVTLMTSTVTTALMSSTVTTALMSSTVTVTTDLEILFQETVSSVTGVAFITTTITSTALPISTTLTITTNTAIATVTSTLIINYNITLTAPNLTTSFDTTTEEFSRNYGLAQIGANYFYERGYFGQGVTVGVVDSGVRTTHFDLTSNLIPGRRADSSGNLHTDINDADGHGTFVAGIIGAAFNGTLVQGVAPSASIMPLQFGDPNNGRLNGEPLALWGYAATSGVQILNNSWGMDNNVTGYYGGNIPEGTVDVFIPWLKPLLSYGSGLVNEFSRITATVGSADMVFVWEAGNHHWHEGGDIELDSPLMDLPIYVSQTDFINNFTLNYDGQEIDFSTLSIDLNDPGGYALAPIYEPSLQGRWVHVIAVDSLSVIADFSNGCGTDTKYWCLAAPGMNISSTYNTSDTAVTVARRGTSFSAPHVSGALAVLKSRLPNMPMSVILALLFNTATDLGETGLDDIYGHGLVNLGKAITLQGSVNILAPIPPSTLSMTSFSSVVSNSITTSAPNSITIIVTTSITSDITTIVTTRATATVAVISNTVILPATVVVTSTLSTVGGFTMSVATATVTTHTTDAMTTFSTVSMTTFSTVSMTAFSTATMTSNMTTTRGTVAGGNNLLMQSDIKLPLVLSGLKEQLKEVLVAVEFLPGYYYNTPLSGLIEVAETTQSLGGAAADMLRKTESTELGYGFSVLQTDGTIQGLSHETGFWRLGYDICATCDTSLWEVYQSNYIAKPFFVNSAKGMSFAAKIGESLELFAAAGLEEDNAEETTYEQYGFRWRHTGAGGDISSLLEFSQTGEEGSLYGGEYNGAFALSGSETYQGRIRTEKILVEGWRGMADYQFGWTESEAQGGGLITDISRLRFDGWRLGVEGRSLFGVPFGGGGLMRFGMTRQAGIRSGTMRLRYGVSGESTEYVEDYQYLLNNDYTIVEREFSLATKPTMLYHWGYTFTPSDGIQTAFGLEYNSTSKERAASLKLNWSY